MVGPVAAVITGTPLRTFSRCIIASAAKEKSRNPSCLCVHAVELSGFLEADTEVIHLYKCCSNAAPVRTLPVRRLTLKSGVALDSLPFVFLHSVCHLLCSSFPPRPPPLHPPCAPQWGSVRLSSSHVLWWGSLTQLHVTLLNQGRRNFQKNPDENGILASIGVFVASPSLLLRAACCRVNTSMSAGGCWTVLVE